MQLPAHFQAATDGEYWDIKLRSPGRINILGEHLDYNGGLVMPAAIDKAIYFAVRKREQQQLRFQALDIAQTFDLPISQQVPSGKMWVDYLLGVINEFRKLGYSLPGMDVVFGGNLPMGGGVSSSAAMEAGMAFACNELLAAPLSRPELAQLCQRSSNQFMGIPSGIMDQFASLNGEKNKVLLLDCSTLMVDKIPLQLPAYRFVLVNSMVSHNLGDSEYPKRVAECAEGLAMLRDLASKPGPNKNLAPNKSLAPASRAIAKKNKPSPAEELSPALKDQKSSELWSSYPLLKGRVSDTVYRRCRYVAAEMARVQDAIKAINAQDAEALGATMNATHAGLRDDYEVSCPEVDFLQQFAHQYPGVAGSRIMGGGFGGCTLNLVKTKQIDAFFADISRAYQEKYQITPFCFGVELSAGTELLMP